jgi:hypothetical protein
MNDDEVRMAERELIDRLYDEAMAAQEEAALNDVLNERGAALTLPEDRPVRIRVTPCGVKLAFFHASRPMVPYKLTIPHEQWAQMVRLITYPPPGVQGFEAFVGFTEEALALHRIDAVEADVPSFPAEPEESPAPGE